MSELTIVISGSGSPYIIFRKTLRFWITLWMFIFHCVTSEEKTGHNFLLKPRKKTSGDLTTFINKESSAWETFIITQFGV